MLRTILKPFSFLPALLMMYMIFSFSAQEGEQSAALSYKISYYAVETAAKVIHKDMEPSRIEYHAHQIHPYVRKAGHMTEYFALAIAVSFPLYVYGMRGILLMFMAGVICVSFAVSDEYHQSFVAGRGPSERDVLIDSGGVFLGIIFTRIVGWIGRHTIFRPKKKIQPAPAMQRVVISVPEQPAVQHTAKRKPSSVSEPPKPEAKSRKKKPSQSSAPVVPEELLPESDQLTEDMSFRKLIRDLRRQHSR